MSGEDIVSRDVSREEVLVRGIVHPLFCSISKNKLKREAFQPPPDGGNEVSTLRLRYTNPHFCKQHTKQLKIGGHTYAGLAIVEVSVVRQVDEEMGKEGEHVAVVATPIDEHEKVINDPAVIVRADSPGLPMHADILYSFNPVAGQTLPSYVRKFAEAIRKKAKLIIDSKPNDAEWGEGDLVL